MLFSVDGGKVLCAASIDKPIVPMMTAKQWVEHVSPAMNGKGGMWS